MALRIKHVLEDGITIIIKDKVRFNWLFSLFFDRLVEIIFQRSVVIFQPGERRR